MANKNEYWLHYYKVRDLSVCCDFTGEHQQKSDFRFVFVDTIRGSSMCI